MLDWIANMDQTVTSSQGQQIEDLISKLQGPWRQQMQETAGRKDKLLQEGQQLLANSGDVRASDIEQRLQNVEQQWQKLEETAAARYNM